MAKKKADEELAMELLVGQLQEQPELAPFGKSPFDNDEEGAPSKAITKR